MWPLTDKGYSLDDIPRQAILLYSNKLPLSPLDFYNSSFRHLKGFPFGSYGLLAGGENINLMALKKLGLEKYLVSLRVTRPSKSPTFPVEMIEVVKETSELTDSTLSWVLHRGEKMYHFPAEVPQLEEGDQAAINILIRTLRTWTE